MSPAITKWFGRLVAILYHVGCLSRMAYAQEPRYTDSLARAALHTATDSARADVLIGISLAYKGHNIPKQFYYANEAAALADKDKLISAKMNAEWLIGDSYIRVEDYRDAILHLRQSIAASKKAARPDHERKCLQLMIHCYHMLDSLDEAAAYQKLLLDLTAQAHDTLGECNQMSAYAQRLSDLGRYGEAIAYLQKDIALAKARLRGDQRSRTVADLLNTLATAHITANDTRAALACLDTAFGIAKQLDDRSLEAYITSSYCDVHTATRSYDMAISYGLKTLRYGEALDNLDLQRQYTAILSRLYQDKGQPAAALHYHIQSDSLAAVFHPAQQIIDQVMQLTRVNMEQQAERIKLEEETFDATQKTQQASLIAALVAVLALIVLTVLTYRNLRQKQRSNVIISRQAESLRGQNELIDRALKEKEVMLKETHHRVKNNLQFISSLLELQLADLKDEHALNALRSAQKRIQSIATVHNALTGSDGADVVDFSGFAGDLFTRLQDAFGSRDQTVRFDNEVPVTYLPLHTAVLLGLILNELLTNSFKHAFIHADRPAIKLSLKEEGQEYMLLYLDNGPGLPQAIFDAPAGSLGLYLIKRISKQLKGTANYTFDAGSRFTIRFRNTGH